MTASSDFPFPLINIASKKNEAALLFSAQAHEGTKNKGNGSDYVLHPVTVCMYVAGCGGDRDALCAALLHDVVEDTDATIEQIRRQFGMRVAAYVASVTKSGATKAATLEDQAGLVIEQLDTVFPVGDLIKGADVLHNMTRTVHDFEDGGLGSLRLFKSIPRAVRKTAHYLELSGKVADRLEGTQFARMSSALRFRAEELTLVRSEAVAFLDRASADDPLLQLLG
jgi:(p)ppGpp synthase/HD superfamily hydrolase